MFQNIQNDFQEEQDEQVDDQVNKVNKKERVVSLIKKLFTKQQIVLYLISFMVSCIGFGTDFAPFGLAIVAACISNYISAGIVFVLTAIGTFVGFGASSLLTYILSLLVFTASILVIRPKVKIDETNEKRKVGFHLVFATLVVGLFKIFLGTFYVYDLLMCITNSIATYVFYKIFANSVPVIKEYGMKKAFAIEEVIGTSLLLAIAISCLGDFAIFGFSIKNILCILLVMILGWKNGILVGTTSGVTIGVVLGIIGNNQPIMVAAYALSGMIAGVLNKFGKIGVIAGFILGNGILAYVANGNTIPVIHIQEILIASLGLLAVPKNIVIDIEDLFGKTKLLPDTGGRVLEGTKETIYKLNNMSETISEMAKSYQEAAATIVEENETKEAQEARDIFLDELENSMLGDENNLLYDDILDREGEISKDIFRILVQKGEISKEEIIQTFAKYNNYIVGFETEEANSKIEEDLQKVLKALNYTYKISKLNYIWKQKIKDSKKVISNQLEGVSKVISDLAEDMKQETEAENITQKIEEIKVLLNGKEIYPEDISLKREKSGKYIIKIYEKVKNDFSKEKNIIEKTQKILSKVLNQTISLQSHIRLEKERNLMVRCYSSEDKYTFKLGIAKAKKENSPVSGDSSLQIKLEDGKYLLAISDGMGSGPEARKSSKVAVKMLERLLTSGFDKEVSLDLINSTLSLNAKDDMYATLDISILDLYTGNIEFIKNGACPTFIKESKQTQIMKAISLPAGVLNNIDLSIYDKDIERDQILVMCSDGIIESNSEYKNKELWVKDFLDKIETDDPQKIADLLLLESIDNNFGVAKDDMTVIVAKIDRRETK